METQFLIAFVIFIFEVKNKMFVSLGALIIFFFKVILKVKFRFSVLALNSNFMKNHRHFHKTKPMPPVIGYNCKM